MPLWNSKWSITVIRNPKIMAAITFQGLHFRKYGCSLGPHLIILDQSPRYSDHQILYSNQVCNALFGNMLSFLDKFCVLVLEGTFKGVLESKLLKCKSEQYFFFLEENGSYCCFSIISMSLIK